MRASVRVLFALAVATCAVLGLAYTFAGCSSEDPTPPVVDAGHAVRSIPLDARASAMQEEAEAAPMLPCVERFCPPATASGGHGTQIR